MGPVGVTNRVIEAEAAPPTVAGAPRHTRADGGPSAGPEPARVTRPAASAAGAEPAVSVVVPTYNRREALARLLASLARQTLPPRDFEVVVVDDGSTDGTADWLRSRDFPYPLRVVAGAHQGPSAARNAGVDAASGARVLFVDDDVVPVPENLAEHVATAGAHGVERTVVMGPLSPPPGVPRPPWLRWVDATLARQYRSLATGEFVASPRQFYTANAAVPRALLQRVGGFDTRFLRDEDAGLAYRLEAAGARFAFALSADVYHFAEHSFATWRRTAYQYGRYEVVMERAKGLRALRVVTREFHRRHPLTRAVARIGVGRPALIRPVVTALGDLALVADRLHAERVAMLALSVISNLLYWQGVADELGGAAELWRRVDATIEPAPTPGR